MQKHKPAPAKKAVRKYRSSVFDDVRVKSGRKPLEVEKFSFAEIEKVAAEFGGKLKETIARGNFKGNRQVFDFHVVVEGNRVRITQPEVSGAEVMTKVKEFDVDDAGRKLVLEMKQAEGGAWTGAELESHFGLSPATLHKRRSEFRIVWWKDAKSQFHYPQWQFDPGGALLGGVQEVLQTFRSADQWRVMRYFLTPWHQLGDRRPLDWLREGQVEKVVAHAKAHGEENSW
jgi:hypothetical protein